MIRDTLRAALTILVMAVAAAILVETRFQLVAIDLAVDMRQVARSNAPQPVAGQPGPLRRLGRATLDVADAALSVVR